MSAGDNELNPDLLLPTFSHVVEWLQEHGYVVIEPEPTEPLVEDGQVAEIVQEYSQP